MSPSRNIDTEPAPPRRFDEAGDATRRTLLANERTYLAWWRTGLTALAVGVGAGKLVPELTGGTQWPYAALGGAYGGLGVLFIAYGLQRVRAVEAAVGRGEYARLDARFVAALAAGGIVLALLTIVLITY